MPEMNANDAVLGTYDDVFVDTNILIYANLTESPFHQHAIQILETLHQQESTLWISRQILREYLSAMTKREILTHPIAITSLIEDIQSFSQHFCIAEDSPLVTKKLLALVKQIAVGGAQIHDANIIATMQAYNIPTLLTHNTKDFKRFSSLITLLPLVE
jgi:predicted nucleic acid-binding protein